MSEQGPATDMAEAPAPASHDEPSKGRLKRVLLPMGMRYPPIRHGIGVHRIYRDTGGALIVGGLAYAALFALIPTIVLATLGIVVIINDPQVRQDAIELLNKAFPALEGVTQPAIDGSRQIAATGAIVALIGFAWGASGLYLTLTRAMERFFPGERVSGALARIVGLLVVVLIIVGVLAAVFVAGVLTVLAQALAIDTEGLLAVVGAMVTLALATGLAYGIYRIVPANPPRARSARLPAVLVGLVIGLMTLLYAAISPWLVSGFAAFGVMASVFVALVWLRVVFLAVIYGAAMARYLDHVALASERGEAEPDAVGTDHVISQEQQRLVAERKAVKRVEEDVASRAKADSPDAG